MQNKKYNMHTSTEIAFRSVTVTWNIFMYRVYKKKYGENYSILIYNMTYVELIILRIYKYTVKPVVN
jgi:hypothetical protein